MDILSVCNSILKSTNHLVGRSQKVDRGSNVYHNLLETSSVQTQNQKYSKDRENQHLDMTHVPRRFYRQVIQSDQKQAYVFVENDAIGPTENSR